MSEEENTVVLSVEGPFPVFYNRWYVVNLPRMVEKVEKVTMVFKDEKMDYGQEFRLVNGYMLYLNHMYFPDVLRLEIECRI